MELKITKKDEVYIISIIRSLGITNTFDFKREVRKLVEKGAEKIIISFEHAKYIDSSGITALISMNNYMKMHNIESRFTDIKVPVKHIFNIAHLEYFFQMTETSQKAIAELCKNPAPFESNKHKPLNFH